MHSEETDKKDKKKRSKGAGHLFKRGSVFYLQFDVNGKRKKVSLGVTNQRQAEKKASEILEPLREGTTKEKIAVHIGKARELISHREIVLDDAWEKFSINQRKDLSDGTRGNYERQWEAFKSWVEDKHPEVTQLAHVTEDIALEYAEKLDKVDHLSTSAFNQHRGTLIRIFRRLSKQAGIHENPMEEMEAKAAPGITRKELNEVQIMQVLNKFEDPDFKIMHKDEMRVLFHMGTWTGLRLKDCILMKWENVNLDSNRIFCIPVKTKAHGNTVIIPIHPSLRKELDKAEAWRNNEYILPEVSARYLAKPTTLKKDVVKVFSECGFVTNQQVGNRKKKTNVIGFHSLRHSFVSFCAKAGVPLPVVQAIVGHGNPAMTRHYVHIGEESVKQAIDALPPPPDNAETVDEVTEAKAKIMAISVKSLDEFKEQATNLIADL